MAQTTTTTTDAVRFLRDQHDQVRDLLASVASTAGDERREVFEPLVRLLAVHETAEELVVYPALRTAGGGADGIVEARLREEDQAKKDLADLEQLDLASPAFDELLGRVRIAVEAHAEREEQEVFPLLEQVTDEAQLVRMTAALQVAEGLAPTHPHRSAPESAVGNAVVGPLVAVVDRARDAIRDATR